MVFEHLKPKPLTRITSSWGAQVVDAIELCYGLAKRGDPDKPYYMFYGYYGYFFNDLYVQNRRVIKDGDPISIYEIQEPAKTRITEAIDASKQLGDISTDLDLIKDYTGESRDILRDRVSRYLELVYGRSVSIESYTGEIKSIARESRDMLSSIKSDTSEIKVHTSEIRDKVVKIDMDEYGRVGVIIAEPIDEYGRVRTSVEDAYKPVSSSIKVSASQNTYGVEVSIVSNGRPNVNVFYSLGGAGEVVVEVSIDGKTWRELDRVSLSAAGSGIKIYQGVAYPYVRARVPTTAIDVELEIVASR